MDGFKDVKKVDSKNSTAMTLKGLLIHCKKGFKQSKLEEKQ